MVQDKLIYKSKFVKRDNYIIIYRQMLTRSQRSQQIQSIQLFEEGLSDHTNPSCEQVETMNGAEYQEKEKMSIRYEDPFELNETSPIFQLPNDTHTNQSAQNTARERLNLTPIIDMGQLQIKQEQSIPSYPSSYFQERDNQGHQPQDSKDYLAQNQHSQMSRDVSIVCKKQFFTSFLRQSGKNQPISLSKLLQIFQKYLKSQIKIQSARYNSSTQYQVEYLWKLGDFKLWNTYERAMEQNYKFYVDNLNGESLNYLQSIGITLPNMNLREMKDTNEFNFELRKLFESIIFEAIVDFEGERSQVSRQIIAGKQKLIMRKSRAMYPKHGRRNANKRSRTKYNLKSEFDEAIKLAQKIVSKTKKQTGNVINIYINSEKKVDNLKSAYLQKKRLEKWIKEQEKEVKKQNPQIIDLQNSSDQ